MKKILKIAAIALMLAGTAASAQNYAGGLSGNGKGGLSNGQSTSCGNCPLSRNVWVQNPFNGSWNTISRTDYNTMQRDTRRLRIGTQMIKEGNSFHRVDPSAYCQSSSCQ